MIFLLYWKISAFLQYLFSSLSLLKGFQGAENKPVLFLIGGM